MKLLLRTPSAFLPIIMSLAALLLVLSFVVLFGIQDSQKDEGAAARMFQLLLVGQIPIVAFFAVNWIPKMPKQALQILALQIVFALIPLVAVFILEQ